ncbi:MAG TPA: hypothetical protein VK988_01995, partial [Acidimicrobiales bacterium]|nr:hypothetical protein [Acidimicrobiales bacterium]
PALGERRNPYAFGDSVVLSRGDQDYWEVRVLDFVADAAEEVAAENPSNEPPAEGRQFALVTIEVTYLGPDEPTNLFGNLEFGAVDDSNVAYDFEDDCGIIPDRIDQYGDLYRGGTVTGNMCWEVRSNSIESLLLTVGATSAAGPPIFMALR